MNNVPKLIVVEGIDGSGKTTAIDIISNELRDKDINHVVLKGLGSGVFGDQIREMALSGKLHGTSNAAALCLSLVMCIDEIRKNLDQGITVVCDRFIGSFLAYNIYTNAEFSSYDFYMILIHYVNLNIPKDYLNIHINTDPSIAKGRVELRGDNNVIDNKPIKYFESVSIGYDGYYRCYLKDNNEKASIKIIDNNGDLSELERHIKQIIYKEFSNTDND